MDLFSTVEIKEADKIHFSVLLSPRYRLGVEKKKGNPKRRGVEVVKVESEQLLLFLQ